MKLRIHEQSIRLRVVPQELAALRNEGVLRTELPAPDSGTPLLRYGLELRQDAEVSTCRLAPGAIRIVLSATDLDLLQNTPQESIQIRVPLPACEGRADRLLLYIEKDRRPQRG